MNNVATIIYSARAIIRKAGWAQGALRCDRGFCIVGAIIEASGPDEELRWAAVDCVARACGTNLVTPWNDAPKRLVSQVDLVMTKAITIAQTVHVPRKITRAAA